MNKKQKNILLVIVFIITLFICYQLAIRKTLDQKRQFNVLNQEALLFKDGSKKLYLIKQKEHYYDSLLTKNQLYGSSVQNNLLKFINTFARKNNIKVISFLEPHKITKNGLTIKTYNFIVEGVYNDINGLLYELEQQTKFGEIISLHFEKKKDFRINKYYLQASVLLKISC